MRAGRYTVPEALDYLGISRPTLEKLIDNGILHPLTLGGDEKGERHFTKEDLDQALRPIKPGEPKTETPKE